MIEARNITYSIGKRRILDDVSLDLRDGEVVGVLGANGAGKTTLRRVLSGDIAPDHGEATLNGRMLADWDVRELARVRAVLPQESTLNFAFRVEDIVLMGRSPHLEGMESEDDFRIVREVLRLVDAEGLEDRLYPTLSGGERQRVHLARVLAQIWEDTGGPRFLFLDEPTSNLDLRHQHQALAVVRKLCERRIGSLVVLHDLNLAVRYADRVLLMKDGRSVAFGPTQEVLTAELIREVFDVEVDFISRSETEPPAIIWKDSVRRPAAGD